MRLVLFPGVFICLLFFNSSAQNLGNERTSSLYTYIYRIPGSYALQVIAANNPDLKTIFNYAFIDSFFTDSVYQKDLPVGNYLFVKADKKELSVAYKNESHLIAEILPAYGNAKLIVRTKGGDTLPSATVLDSKRLITYNPRAHAYLLLPKNKERYLTIATPGDTLFYQVNKVNNYVREYDFGEKFINAFRRFGRRVRYGFKGHNRNNRYDGYIVFNKPEYLPADTVKLKAFLTKRNGKAINRPLNVQIEPNYGDNWKLLKEKLKPVSKGAYTFEFPLADSFKIDQQYNLRFATKSGHTIKEKYFKIEDYLLRVNQYTAKSRSDTYNPRDTIHVDVTGADFNGMPVMDGHVKITATPAYINSFAASRVFVPDTLFVIEKDLNASGKAQIDYPCSLLPAASINISLHVEVTNSNNEFRDTWLSPSFEDHPKEIKVNRVTDSLKADYMVNGLSKPATGFVKIFGPDAILLDTYPISYPFKTSINPFATYYMFSIPRDSLVFNQTLRDETNINCISYRSDTNVTFQVLNPDNIRFYYSLFKNSSLIDEGATNILNKNITDHSDAFYQLCLQYQWNGKKETKTFRAEKAKNELQIDLDNKNDIFPGQKDTFNVSVRKFNQRPARHVNLTAYSINGQFASKNSPPDVPFWGRAHLFHKHYFNLSLKQVSASCSSLLYKYPEWQQRMNLQSQPYYRMISPKGWFAYYNDSLPDSTAQLALYIFKHANGVKIYSVHMDGKLVYSEQNQLHTPYSFTANRGFHQVIIRTVDRSIIIDSVFFKPHYKLELSYNYDSLLKNYPKPNMPCEYTPKEKRELAGSMIMLNRKTSNYNRYMLWQGNRVFDNSNSNYDYGIKIAGPFSYDDIYYRRAGSFTIPFMPEPNYAYSFSPGIMRLEKYEPFKSKMILTTTYTNAEEHFGELALPPVLEKAITYKGVRYKTDAPDFNKSSGMGRLQLLIKGDSSFTYLRIYKFDSNWFFQTYLVTARPVNLMPGNYELMLITESGNYVTFSNTEVQANGLNYYELQPQHFLKLLRPDNLKAALQIDSLSTGEQQTFQVDRAIYGSAALIGKIRDDAGMGVPYAPVILLKNNIRVATAMSDEAGNYDLENIAAGNYTLQVSYIGYETATVKNISIRNDLVNVVNVYLKQSSVGLNEVVVTANANRNSIAYDEVESVQIAGASMGVRGSRNHRGLLANTLSHVVYCPAFLSLDSTSDANGTGDLLARGSNLDVDKSSAESGTERSSRIAHELSNKYADAKTLRNNFRDYGFWQPNIITDKQGKATFAAQYPDNITAWQTYVIGMDGKRRSGMTSKTVRSYKELNATLNTPQFLIEGDSSDLQGKIMNYTGTPLKVVSSFSLNGQPQLSKEAEVKDVWTDYIASQAGIVNTESDTLKAAFKINLAAGFADGEERSIPVFPKGTLETKGKFAVLQGDTGFVFEPDTTMGDISIHAESDLLQVLLDEIKHLKEYPYWCTEQTASRLIALSMEMKIDSVLGIAFKEQKEKQRIVKKLLAMQLYSGGFSWWENAPYNIHLTNYVLCALYKAGVKPEATANIHQATVFLKDNLDNMNTGEKLNTLQTFARYTDDKDYVIHELRTIRFDSLSLNQQLSLVLVQVLCGIDSPTYWKKLLSKKHSTLLGGCYWGEETYSFINNCTASTLLAYEIAEINGDQALQQQIISYLLTTRSHDGWTNTYESARILSTILPKVIEQRGRHPAQPVLKINNTSIEQFPYNGKLPVQQNMAISKSGGAVLYFTAYQKFFNKQPSAVNNVFDINTGFQQAGVKVEQLKAGELTEMIVNVYAHKYAEYVSIEIPIPAGCTYSKKDFPYAFGEVHREYFKNKVVIFCEKIHEGNNVFRILLEPRYSGKYTLNPARAELMYFPVFFGRDEMRSVRIEKQ